MDFVIQSFVDTWRFAPRILITMFLSLYVSQVMLELGFFQKLAFVGRPLVRLARLPHQAGVAFAVSFGSVIAGNTIIAQLYHERKIGRLEAFLAALLNATPVYIKETFTYQLPVMIPLLGFKVGMVYFATFIVSGVMKTLFVVFSGRMWLPGVQPPESAESDESAQESDTLKKTMKEVLVLSFSRRKNLFYRVSSTFLLITFIVFLSINCGLLARIEGWIEPLTNMLYLPAACIIPVGTYMLSPIVGATSIGTLLQEGVITDMEGIIACLLGSFLMLPIFSLRYSFANYTALFGFRLGSGIVGTSTGISMLNRLLFLVVCILLR